VAALRNHFVPKFLLNAWAASDPEGKICVFTLTDRGVQTSRLSPKSTGYEDDLLTLTRDVVAGMDKHAIERVFLQIVDNDAHLVRQKLLTQGLASLTREDRFSWVRFIMSLQIRQPSVVFQLREEASLHLRESLASQPEEYEAVMDELAPPTLEEWTEQQFPGLIENFGLSFFHELVDNPSIGTKILGLRWWLWDFSVCSHHLLLADRPCIFAGGIDDPNLVIMLPLSPAKAFIATRGEHTAAALRQQTAKGLIGRLNNATVLQAQKRIYAKDESPVRFICNRRSRLVPAGQ
jgi:hypothetical protein